MERTKPTTVWIDGKEVGTNSNISTAQQYELSSYLSPGSHDIAIIVDNGKQAVPEKVYGSSHAYSSSTQTNWNGIIGDFFHKIHSFSSRYLITSQSCRISAFYIRSRNKSTIKRISYVLFGIQSETVLLSTGSFWCFLPVLIPVVFSIHMRFLVCTFSSRIRDFGADSPALGAGKLVLVRQKSFVGQGPTCSVRLNRESSFVGLLRDVHGVLWSGEVSSFPLSDSDFAKLESDNRLVNSA